MTITINEKNYRFDMAGWWGPQYKYEEVMNVAEHPERRFNPLLTFHLHVMFYCILLCDNDPLDLSLEDFLAALENLDLNRQLTEYYTQHVEILTKSITPKQPQPEDSKKKSSRRTKSMKG